jgi:adenylate cyclase
VIARNSSFSYKGTLPDIRQVGRDLGVRYVLEGSIRKSSNRIRVTGQLVDTFTGNHLWAERYDRVLEDIFRRTGGTDPIHCGRDCASDRID